ncbi:MAG: iron-sulfur cluster repair di-iron protein [bacterium]
MTDKGKIDVSATVREIAVKYPQSLKVFERYGIDYCCGGGKRLTDAAGELEIDIEELLRSLEEARTLAPENSETLRDWTSMSIVDLINHIDQTHHTFLKGELPRLEQILDTVVHVHGANHSDTLFPLRLVFKSLKTNIGDHLNKEEKVLFPLISEKESPKRAGEHRTEGHNGGIHRTVDELISEHNSLGAALSEIRWITYEFKLPEDACPTYIALYDGLKTLESDVHRHVHLENNVLFPRTVAAEQ